MKRHLNLLTERFRLRMLVRRRLREWGIVAGVILSASLAWIGYQRTHISYLQAELAARLTQSAPVARMRERNARIGSQISLLQERQTLLAQLQQGKLPYQVIALVSRSAGQNQDAIHVAELVLAQAEVAQSPPATPATEQPAPKPREETVLLLKGTASDNLAVARFVAALRRSNAFSDVDLKSSLQEVRPSISGRSYWIECRLHRL